MVSRVSQALEHNVAAIHALTAKGEGEGFALTPHEEAIRCRHFSAILDLLEPRIRYFTRQYGLGDISDDARQACAIGVHRAIETYRPERASFTTLVNWQLRGELQSLRHRVRLDQRDSAVSAGRVTVPIDWERPDSGVFAIADEEALPRVEAGASNRMALQYADILLDRHFGREVQRMKLSSQDPATKAVTETRLALERGVMDAYFRGSSPPGSAAALCSEKRRQIMRRTFRKLGAMANLPDRSAERPNHASMPARQNASQ